MSIFEYGFMQRAFLVGILLAVITPLIGMTVVLKRMSMVGDALAHASLAGVAIGMLFGINPVAGAGGICVVRRFGVVFPGIQKMRLRSLCLLE
jgi:zinc transport system permease protein